jgi:hypothetical protein
VRTWCQGQITHEAGDDPEWYDVGSGEPNTPQGQAAAADWAWRHTSSHGRWRVVQITERVMYQGRHDEEPKL